MDCFFCYGKEEFVFENELARAIYDDSPVSKGHMLVFTKRHTKTYFDTTKDEKLAIMDLIKKCKTELDEKYNPDGYNIGCNCGVAAGQSVMHTHIHIIPRYNGDVENPRGGVRGVIPKKQNY